MRQRLETKSPTITARDFVSEPLYTGLKIVDTLIPIGKGQRQLLVGDEGLGARHELGVIRGANGFALAGAG